VAATIAFETKRRSIVKSLSWRLVAAIITTSIAFLMTGQMEFAAKIGLADTAIKLLIYFAHERIWIRIPYGREPTPDYEV
jgi:uncharacterized membrane protein